MKRVSPVRVSTSTTTESVARASIPGNEHAPAVARAFIRDVLTAPSDPSAPAGVGGSLLDDALLLVSELVSNAVVHAGTSVEVVYRRQQDPGTTSCEASGDGTAAPDGSSGRPGAPGIVIEVADRHPARTLPGEPDAAGRGLQLVRSLAQSWGVTHHRQGKTIWFRLEDGGPEAGSTVVFETATPAHEARPLAPGDRHPWPDWGGGRAPSFLAEMSELLAEQLDEDMIVALAAQLLVPRIADWCAVWLATEGGPPRLARVWHAQEQRIDALRRALEHEPPPAGLAASGVPWPWPASPDGAGPTGYALAFPLTLGTREHGAILIGRAGPVSLPDETVRVVQDVARRVAQSVATARKYTHQTTISRVLQRRQLPPSLPVIPGMEAAVVYEPRAEGQDVGGDFYDLFPIAEHRWSFLLGDVCGSDPEAMSVTGLARHLVRLLAREGHGVAWVLGRLNAALTEESAEAELFAGEYAPPRFLSLLYGELQPDTTAGGAFFEVGSAGHPLPLRLRADGSVGSVASPQMLLGIDRNATFTTDSFFLAPGETLLCVTDGVTERRDGRRQLDDHDGLARILHGCAGLGAKAVAECVRRTTHEFGPEPPDDDLAVLVLEAVPRWSPVAAGFVSVPAEPAAGPPSEPSGDLPGEPPDARRGAGRRTREPGSG